MKPKRLVSMADSIPNDLEASGRVVLPFSMLKPGVNAGTVIFGKTVFNLVNKGFLPHTVLITDRNKDFVALSLYNFGTDVVNIGDLVKIPDPYVKVITTHSDGKEMSYTCVQVMFPSLTINGQEPGSDVFQGTALKLDKTTVSSSSS